MIGRRTYETDQTAASQILQRNERAKALSGLLRTFGVALIIAGASRWFYTTIDTYTILWLVIGFLLIWIGFAVLSLLETEN